jgi:hypothetical protein
LLALDLLILLRARGVITGKVKVPQGSTCSGHDLLELLVVVVVSEAVLLLVIALNVELFRLLLLYLFEESSFFLLGQSVMKWVVSPH